MAVNQLHFYSDALGKYTRANIILPLPKRAETSFEPLPTLVLLHGMGHDADCWLLRSNVERYACEAGIAIILPEGELSCYENMAHGPNYRDYIIQELPGRMRSIFPLSHDRSKNFIAGCSMGGCGALKLGLAAPESFSAIGCFSAGHKEYQPDSPRNRQMLALAYGDRLPEIEAQTERNALNPDRPHLSVWHGCGEEDILRENALLTRSFLENAPAMDYHFEMLPGKHDWALWDEMIRRFIQSLRLETPEVALL